MGEGKARWVMGRPRHYQRSASRDRDVADVHPRTEAREDPMEMAAD